MEHLNQLFIDAGTLMLAGMVFVYVFLGLLVVFINTVLKTMAGKYPDAVTQSKNQRAIKKVNLPVDSVSPSVVAAIASAVSQYRQQHHRQK